VSLSQILSLILNIYLDQFTLITFSYIDTDYDDQKIILTVSTCQHYQKISDIQ